MRLFLIIPVLFLFVISCKKKDERSCLKSFGADTELEFPLDSIKEFRLYKNISYYFFQDTLRKVIVKGGQNVVNFIRLQTADHILSITNENKCHFLRDFDHKIQVEIHYPFYSDIYSETNDSVIFQDTISADQLHVQQVLGGGGIRLCVNTKQLILEATHGVGNYKVTGQAQYADLRIQTNGSGDASGLKCPLFDIDLNSSGNLLVNLDSAKASVLIRGTGNVIYSGTPDSLIITKNGDGAVVQQ
jgi:hypothetical protein